MLQSEENNNIINGSFELWEQLNTQV